MANKGAAREKPDPLLLGQDAMFEKVARLFPEDLAVALQTAAKIRRALSAPDNVAIEPWPPMHMRNAV